MHMGESQRRLTSAETGYTIIIPSALEDHDFPNHLLNLCVIKNPLYIVTHENLDFTSSKTEQ